MDDECFEGIKAIQLWFIQLTDIKEGQESN